MKIIIIFFLLVLVLFLTACAKTTDYSAYSQSQGQQQNDPYVGGGCGVAPQNDEFPLDCSIPFECLPTSEF